MNPALTADNNPDLITAIQAGHPDPRLQKLVVKVLGSDWYGPSRNDNGLLTVSYIVTDGTDSALKYLETRARVVNAEGLILEESLTAKEVKLPAGAAALLKVRFGLKAAILGPAADKALVVIEVTGCDFEKRHLGLLPVPTKTMTPVPLAPVTVNPGLRLVSGCYWRTKSDRNKDVRVEVRCLVQNLTAQYLPEVRLDAHVHDTWDREITGAGARLEVPPRALRTLAGCGHGQAIRFKYAKIELGLRVVWPVAQGLGHGEMGSWPPDAELTLHVQAHTSRIAYTLRGNDEQQAALRAALEQDADGTLAALIEGNLDLGEIEDRFRGLIDLPPEVQSVSPIGVYGSWAMNDEGLSVSIDVEWLLPLKTRPADEEEMADLQDALSNPAGDATYIDHEEEYGGLEFDGDNGGGTDIDIPGYEF